MKRVKSIRLSHNPIRVVREMKCIGDEKKKKSKSNPKFKRSFRASTLNFEPSFVI
jgi:hypothetical protein